MQPTNTTDAPPNPEVVFDVLMAYQRTAALKTAIELGVFRAIGEGHVDVPSLAKQCSASERGTRILCDFLCIHRILAKENGRYRHTPTSATFLDPRSPASIASIATFLVSKELREPFDHLAEIVRTGRTVLPGQGNVEPENPIWVAFAANMAPMMGPMAGPMATLVLEGKTGPIRVLDIAAGHGLFGIEIAKQNKQARITGQDWRSVLQFATDNARKAGVQDRYELLPGNAFEVEFGGPYDVVLLTNFLHHFDVPTCVTLLKKVHKVLRPGGRVATLEFVPNEDRISPPTPAAFSMTMLSNTAAGDAYTLSELTRMHQDAGFSNISSHPIPMSPHTLVMARG